MARHRYLNCGYYNRRKDAWSKSARWGFNELGCLDCQKYFTRQREDIDKDYIKNVSTAELVGELRTRHVSIISVDKCVHDRIPEIIISQDSPCNIIIVDK